MKTQNLSFDYLNASRLLLPQGNLSILLVGCGGTGSWLAPSIVRIARLLMEKFGRKVELFFIDPDRVEAKNCYRQNFCEAEIGHPKADSLAYRYGLAWGVEIVSVVKPFDPSVHNLGTTPRLVVGCVDNGGARRSIAMAGYSSGWWLDCGNTKSVGQVLLGTFGKKPKNPFELGSVCSWLPAPSKQHPELLEDQVEDQQTGENLSCADLALLDSQSLSINQRMAAEASDYLVRLLITQDLRKMATYIDLGAGSARSVYITPENVLKKKGNG